jgi:pimeloyl-ACP methyl ester carboxylesterase
MGLLILILIAILLLWLLGAAGLVHALGHPRRKTFAVALGKGDPTDPADLGLEAQEVAFTLSDRSRTSGWVIQGCNAQGPTVVIVHGFGDSRYGSLKRAPLVGPWAKRVVVFDLPGQGESESKRAYGGLREPDDVLAVLGQLEKQDAERIVLLGSSMGAGIAIAAAAKAEAEIRDAIVGVIAEGPYRLWDEPLHNLFRKHRYPRWPIIPLAGLWLWLTAKGFRDFDRAGHAAKLTCPLLVLHGSEDPLCPITSARQIAEAAPVGEFIEIQGGSHEDLPSEHEQAYRDAVGDFLKMLCDRGGSGTM